MAVLICIGGGMAGPIPVENYVKQSRVIFLAQLSLLLYIAAAFSYSFPMVTPLRY